MEFHILFSWASPFLFFVLLGGIFHFSSNINRTFSKQTVETLSRRRILSYKKDTRLIWVNLRLKNCVNPAKRFFSFKMLLAAKFGITFKDHA